jgi:hypothetical protein
MIKAKASYEPGRCIDCRHANQGTEDFLEFHAVACKFGIGGRYHKFCDKKVIDETGEEIELWVYEKYDDNNCTWWSDEGLDLEIPTQ